MNSSTTISELRAQWSSPVDTSSILLVIGGDVVQQAFAQGTGKFYTPVCFSFGCVAYAFIALVNVIGDGRLLPKPDYPVKVINLDSGYARENKNWVVGRMLRDIESTLARDTPLDDDGIRITVHEALWNSNRYTQFSWRWSHLIGLTCTLVQIALAALPYGLYGEWSILLITLAGTVLVQVAGLLPQWKAEKLPNRQRSNAVYALTSGNGSRDIVVIIGRGNCLDLEELSASQSPRIGRPWEKFKWLAVPKVGPDKKPLPMRRDTMQMKSRTSAGFPIGFWITSIASVILSILWLLLLVNVAAPKNHTWFLLAVGGIGMFQNAWLAAKETSPRLRNMPMKRIDTIKTRKVMDGLMDFEATYQRGTPLLKEFFPGRLREEEKKWWAGDTEEYEKKREQDRKMRGISRRREPVFAPSPVLLEWQPSHPSRDYDDDSEYASPVKEKRTYEPRNSPVFEEDQDPSPYQSEYGLESRAKPAALPTARTSEIRASARASDPGLRSSIYRQTLTEVRQEDSTSDSRHLDLQYSPRSITQVRSESPSIRSLNIARRATETPGWAM